MKWKQTMAIQKQRGDSKLSKYRITWKEEETEYSFIYTPKKVTAKHPMDRLREIKQQIQLKKYGYWTHLKDNPIIKVEELPK
jgi:hypothetical protein